MNRRSFLATLPGLGVLAAFGRRASAAPVAGPSVTSPRVTIPPVAYNPGPRHDISEYITILGPEESPFSPWVTDTYQGSLGSVAVDAPEHWVISGMTKTANGETRIHSRKLVVPVRTLDIPRLLRCIAERETRNQDQVIGRSGERSRYQIKRTTWFQHESAPFAYCRGERAYCVALNHVNWLRTKLNDTDSVWMLAYAWNDGLGFRHKARVVEYAAAVENLYYDSTFAG